MKNFCLEHIPRMKCWKIYDMRKHHQIEEPPCIITIGDSHMERIIMAYCLMQGALEPWQLQEEK